MATLAPLTDRIAAPAFALRALASADEAAITAALAQPAVAAMLSTVPHPYPAGAAREWLATRTAPMANGHLVRAVDVGGRLVGVVEISPERESGGAELGYWICPEFAGRGLATAAAGRLTGEALSATAIPGIFARTAVDNPASERVLTKLGFEPVGLSHRFFRARGTTVRCNLFWLDRRGPQTVLETRRLTLTPPCAADIPRLIDLLGDTGIATQMARIPYPYRRADAEAFVADRSAGGERVFAIRPKDEAGALAGCVRLGSPESGIAELGYWLGRAYWGRGYAPEAARAVIDLAFSDDDVHEVHASCRPTNAASRRVLEKCGFQHSGARLMRMVALGGAVPADCFRLDRSTWGSILAWRPAIRRDRRGETVGEMR